MRRSGVILAITAIVLFGAWWFYESRDPVPWSDIEIDKLRSLWIGGLPPVPPDPSNRVADDRRAAELGHKLFFDPRLSGNGNVSCAVCHQPARRFTDGLPKGRAIGLSKRNTPSIVGTAYSPWLFWDGRKDSQWSQALEPLENPAEHGGNRMQYVRLIACDPEYRAGYEALFGTLPDFSDYSRFPEAAAPGVNPEWNAAWQLMSSEDQERINEVFINIGKMIAAYERLLIPAPSRFDAYVEAVLDGDEIAQQMIFNDAEIRGLRLFINDARCTECHNGPLFTNNEFHNTGILSYPGEVPDRGRSNGMRKVLGDPFNCLGQYSDAAERRCAELSFVRTGIELVGAMRTPSLRNLKDTAPYMHKGQMISLAEILDHYNRAPPAMNGHNESSPLGLSRSELRQLEAFLETLAAPPATTAQWLAPPDPAN